MAAENKKNFMKNKKQGLYYFWRKMGHIWGKESPSLEKSRSLCTRGNRQPIPSSVLMNVIPAKVAGVKEIVMATPPSKAGGINPYISSCSQNCRE